MREAEVDANFYITKLNLNAKRHVYSSNLSGGMKRKLHLAMALTGPSKVLHVMILNVLICLIRF